MVTAHAGAATAISRRASLPMYNLPEMRPANAAFWNAIRSELRRQGAEDLAVDLEFEQRPVPAAIAPDMLFTQVCGYPLQTIFRGQAVVLGAPVYAVAHCAGPTHTGVFIVHRDAPYRQLEDLKGSRFVFNSRHSNSGMNLPRRMIAEIAGGGAFFGSIAETHSQPGNIERVARGEADATCVDCVTYAFFRRHRPKLGELTRILAATLSTPSIPFVTAVTTPDDVRARLRTALFSVGRSAEWSDVRAGLLLHDIVAVEMSSYAGQLQHEREAAALGYPELR